MKYETAVLSVARALMKLCCKKKEMRNSEKKVRLTVNLDESNLILLKWLKINLKDDYSATVNSLLARYRNEVTAGMTDFEREQIENLRIVTEQGVIDLQRIKEMRSALLMEKVDLTLQNPEKRAAIKRLIEVYENN